MSRDSDIWDSWCSPQVERELCLLNPSDYDRWSRSVTVRIDAWLTLLASHSTSPIVETLGRLKLDIAGRAVGVRQLIKPCVGVVGSSGSGKSTFLNKSIGLNLLPTSASESCTPVPISLSCSSTRRYSVREYQLVEGLWKRSHRHLFSDEKAVKVHLAAFAKRQQTDAAREWISIGVPEMPLTSSVLVDVPGNNDVEDDRNEAALGLFQYLDHVVFVFNIKRGLSKLDLELLGCRQIAELLRRTNGKGLQFVGTHLDDADEEEKEAEFWWLDRMDAATKHLRGTLSRFYSNLAVEERCLYDGVCRHPQLSFSPSMISSVGRSFSSMAMVAIVSGIDLAGFSARQMEFVSYVIQTLRSLNFNSVGLVPKDATVIVLVDGTRTAVYGRVIECKNDIITVDFSPDCHGVKKYAKSKVRMKVVFG